MATSGYSVHMLRVSFLWLLVVALLPAAEKKTALDRYVGAADPSFAWKLIRSAPGGTSDAFVLEMTSQNWGEGKKVNRTEWKHWVTIVRPKAVKSSTAFLYITGGSNNGQRPQRVDPKMTVLAETLQSVAVELRMVPNQPLTFADDPQPGRQRVEDEIIAWTWRKFIDGGDESWLLRLPMTKAAVRAMDATQQFLDSAEGGRLRVNKFFVSGASKRGWTSWTTAAVDPRVTGMAPLVIDLLNIIPSFVHHYRAYGAWAPAVGDYFAEGLMDEIDNPKYRELLAIEDPYSYRDRLTQPKFIVNAAGDQFFLPDSWKFYWKDLRGEKHLRYVANTDHSMRGSDAFESTTAMADAIMNGKPRPRYSWSVQPDGTILVETKDKPSSVVLWQATNPQARDFRLERIGPAYTSSELKPEKEGRYVAKLAKPEKGFRIYFVEMTFPSTIQFPFKVSTGTVVAPDDYPFGPPVRGKTKIETVPPARKQ